MRFLVPLATALVLVGCGGQTGSDTGVSSGGPSAGSGGAAGGAAVAGSGGSAGSVSTAGAGGATGGSGGTNAGGATAGSGGAKDCLQAYKWGMTQMPAAVGFVPYSCGLPSPCAEVKVDVAHPPPSVGTTLINIDAGAAQCFLATLAGKTPARLQLSWGDLQFFGGEMATNHEVVVYVLGNGEVLYESRENLGCCGALSAVQSQRLVLRDQSYFDQCAMVSSTTALIKCLVGDTEVGQVPTTPPWAVGTCSPGAAACPLPRSIHLRQGALAIGDDQGDDQLAARVSLVTHPVLADALGLREIVDGLLDGGEHEVHSSERAWTPRRRPWAPRDPGTDNVPRATSRQFAPMAVL